MSVVHRMTGYSKVTDVLEVEHDIPSDRLEEICEIAHVPATDVSAVGSYPLAIAAARQIAAKIGQQINLDRYDWFMEPFSS